MAVGAGKAEAFWQAFLRSLKRLGLGGVAKVLGATWQRCKVPFARNAMTHAGKRQRRLGLDRDRLR